MISNDAYKNIYFTAYVIIQNTITTDYHLDDNVLFPLVCNVFREWMCGQTYFAASSSWPDLALRGSLLSKT